MNPNSNIPLATLLHNLQDVANGSFEKAKPIPGTAKHSQEFHQHEMETIFSREWVCPRREYEQFNRYLADMCSREQSLSDQTS